MTRTGLLIIDMQNDLAHPDGRMFIRDAAHRAETMALVLQTFREVRAPVIHAVRSHRSDGWDAERFRLPSYHADRGAFVAPRARSAGLVHSKRFWLVVAALLVAGVAVTVGAIFLLSNH